MTDSRTSFWKAATLMGLAAAAFGTASVANARDNVYWSVGVDAAPGVSVGVSNHRQPVYVAPQPVYVQPAPVYVQPVPVYTAPRVMYAPAPVYYAQPAPVYYGPPGHWKHKHGRGHHKHGRGHWN